MCIPSYKSWKMRSLNSVKLKSVESCKEVLFHSIFNRIKKVPIER